MEKIFIEKCKQCQDLFKKKLQEQLLYNLMLQLIESSPEEIQQQLFIEFTYLLGEYLQLNEKIIETELSR